jgi:hypothetical protein
MIFICSDKLSGAIAGSEFVRIMLGAQRARSGR